MPIEAHLYYLFGNCIQGLNALVAAIHEQKKVPFPENVQYDN